METQDARVVDMRAVGTNVWLVKLPNPLAKALDALEKETTIGSMRIYQPSDDSDEPDAKRARIELELLKSVLPQDMPNKLKLGIENKPATTYVFSERGSGETEAYAAEGRVVTKAVASFPKNEELTLFQSREIERTNQHEQAVQLQRQRNVFNPISKPSATKKDEKWRTKRLRGEEKDVENMVFDIFRRYEYIGLEDLVKETRQPKAHLKSILERICNYSTSSEHKHKLVDCR